MKEKSTEGERSQGRRGRAWRRSPGEGCSGCCSSCWRRRWSSLGAAALRAAGRAWTRRRATGTGVGKPRRLSLMSGTITVRRPRVRGLEARFESRLLPLFKRRTEEVGRLLPELYLHGLAQGDFDLALRGLLGDGAPRCRRRRSRG